MKLKGRHGTLERDGIEADGKYRFINTVDFQSFMAPSNKKKFQPFN